MLKANTCQSVRTGLFYECGPIIIMTTETEIKIVLTLCNKPSTSSLMNHCLIWQIIYLKIILIIMFLKNGVKWWVMQATEISAAVW